MSKELIRLRNLCMAFDDELVLDNINLYINDSEFNNGLYKWFYMDRLSDGNIRMLGKHTNNGGIYEVLMFNPMAISVSNEKPYCGIISVKKVIELFPAAERISGSMYDKPIYILTSKE